MKNTIIFCILSIFFFIGCETTTNSHKNEQKPTEKELVFPDDFIGVYKGSLQITNPKGSQEIPMEYHLLKTDSIHKYDYKLVYNGQPRNYTLIVKNKEKGIFEVDENNGIILPTFLNNNTLHSFFEVQGNLLSSRALFSQNKLEFEILFTSLKNKIKSGGTSEDIPEVFGYPITVFQKAILVKEN
ncbi:Peptidyl-prolyl cis-trans isomerase ppiD [Tenacibaculum sp. 190130A14a]|uniref:Lipoprotein n=1 Tax=Tenacibaculum polynesiense TaxID=3137857 RepID=A0ABM9PCV6_9FLAO